MSEMQVEWKCKDFDSWLSFLGRLDKIGKQYVIKNDIIIPCEKSLVSSDSKEKIPGKHIIKDPLFLDEEGCYVENGVYALSEIKGIRDIFDNMKETMPDYRKRIILFRNKEHIGFIVGIENPVIIEIAKLLSELPDSINAVTKFIGWYRDLIEPINNMVGNGWTELSKEKLTNLRNNGIVAIQKTIGSRHVSTRLARSLFPLAGITRMNTPLALYAAYTFLPSDESDVAILRIHGVYKCGQSTLANVDCVHEYLVLMFEEEE